MKNTQKRRVEKSAAFVLYLPKYILIFVMDSIKELLQYICYIEDGTFATSKHLYYFCTEFYKQLNIYGFFILYI